MKKTPNLDLPIYDNPEEDIFDLEDWNIANQNLDKAFEAIVEGGKLDVINSEVADARGGNPKLKDRLDNINSQLDESTNKGILKLSTMLANGQVTKIKVVADSFGVGIGTTGGTEDPSGILIGTTGAREALKTTPCWANYLRKYLARKYPTVEFFNASIGGYSITSEGLTLGTGWYGTGNDVVIVMLGANDRGDATNVATFKTNATTFLANVKATCNYLIVCSQNNPINEFDTNGDINVGYNFSMEQVDKTLAEICKEKEYTFISIYSEIKTFCQNRGILPKSLVRTEKDGYVDGLHPNNRGSLAIWEILQKNLGILEDAFLMQKSYYSSPIINEDIYVTGDISKLLSAYPLGTTIVSVANAKAVIDGLPASSNGYNGLLTTHKMLDENLSYQEYKTMFGNFLARRDWFNTAWGNWTIYDIGMGDLTRFWKTVSGATPSVDVNTHILVNNATQTDMTNISVYSSFYTILTLTFANGNTTLKQGNFKLAGGTDWTPTQFSSIQLLKTNLSGAWVELSRTQI